MNICLSVITIIIFSFCLIFTCHAIQKNIKNEETKPIIFIDLGLSSNPPTQQIRFAIQVCVGLANRNDKIIGPVYTLQGIDDLKWLQNTGNGNGKEKKTSSTDFLKLCYEHLASGWMRYNYTNQKIIIPNIVTLAAVEDAIPLEDNLLSLLDIDPVKTPPVVDCMKLFPNIQAGDTEIAPREATTYIFSKYKNETNGISKMNPGLDVHGKHKINPPLLGSADLGLVDYIVKEKLFNFFLSNGCLPFTKDYSLMEHIATTNPWPRPLRVYGYDDTFSFAGDLFEAETDCIKEHNMGQIASNGCNNLAFYSRHEKIDQVLKQNPNPPSYDFPYNKSKTYITFIIGDGDNVNFIKGEHFDWMQQRVEQCNKNNKDDNNNNNCLPLTWTQSPAVLHLAPEWMQWYYNQSYITQNEWFVLPPSGDTYSYPGEMKTDDQDSFVKYTEADAILMNTSGTVSWEFFLTWGNAIDNFFPKFEEKGIIKACFAVNVPFMLPVLEFKKGEHYKILNNKKSKEKNNDVVETVILFAPREWRGYRNSSIPFSKHDTLSPKSLADEINNYPPGTVTHIYTTSDGGFHLNQLNELNTYLEEHVSVVNPNELVKRVYEKESLVV